MSSLIFCKEKPLYIYILVNIFAWLGFIILGIIISPIMIAAFSNNPKIMWQAIKDVNSESDAQNQPTMPINNGEGG